MTTAAGRGGEERALRSSLFTYFFMSVLGLGFAIWTGSNAILLDGVFNVVSFIIGLIAIRVARLQSVAASPDFHFGHGHFEPLLNTVRMLMILALAAFALGKAVVALFHGGVPVQAGFGIIYGAIASAGCVSIGLLLRSMSRRCLSPLVEVDAKTWLLNAAVSLAAGLAFLCAFLMEGTAWSHLVPYVDPVLVIVMLAAMIRDPISSLRENIREVLWRAPDLAVQEDVSRRVHGALGSLPTREVILRMVKVGRTFYLMAHLVLPGKERVGRIADLDAIRQAVTDALGDCEPRLVVEVIFTGDRHWATALDVRRSE